MCCGNMFLYVFEPSRLKHTICWHEQRLSSIPQNTMLKLSSKELLNYAKIKNRRWDENPVTSVLED